MSFHFNLKHSLQHFFLYGSAGNGPPSQPQLSSLLSLWSLLRGWSCTTGQGGGGMYTLAWVGAQAVTVPLQTEIRAASHLLTCRKLSSHSCSFPPSPSCFGHKLLTSGVHVPSTLFQSCHLFNWLRVFIFSVLNSRAGAPKI